MNLIVNLFSPDRQAGMNQIPLGVKVPQQSLHSIVGLLLREAMVAQQVNDIMRTPQILTTLSALEIGLHGVLLPSHDGKRRSHWR